MYYFVRLSGLISVNSSMYILHMHQYTGFDTFVLEYLMKRTAGERWSHKLGRHSEGAQNHER
jgi:hypothetical protein